MQRPWDGMKLVYMRDGEKARGAESKEERGSR